MSMIDRMETLAAQARRDGNVALADRLIKQIADALDDNDRAGDDMAAEAADHKQRERAELGDG